MDITIHASFQQYVIALPCFLHSSSAGGWEEVSKSMDSVMQLKKAAPMVAVDYAMAPNEMD